MLLNGIFHLINIIIIGILIFTIKKCRNIKTQKCFILPCTLLVQLIIISYIYLAFLFFFIAENGAQYMNNNCEMLIDDSKISNTTSVEIQLFDFIHEFDEVNNKIINGYMCGSTCKCNAKSNGQVRYELYSDFVYSQYNRTKSSMVYAEKQSAAKLAIYKQDTFDVLDNCFIKKFVEEEDFYARFYRLTEESFDCQGICESSMFYYSKDIANGIPSKSCGSLILKEYADEVFLAGVQIIFVAVLLQLIACCSCKNFSVTEEELDEIRNRAVWAQLRLKQQKARVFEFQLRKRVRGEAPDEEFDEHGLRIEIDTAAGKDKQNEASEDQPITGKPVNDIFLEDISNSSSKVSSGSGSAVYSDDSSDKSSRKK